MSKAVEHKPESHDLRLVAGEYFGSFAVPIKNWSHQDYDLKNGCQLGGEKERRRVFLLLAREYVIHECSERPQEGYYGPFSSKEIYYMLKGLGAFSEAYAAIETICTRTGLEYEYFGEVKRCLDNACRYKWAKWEHDAERWHYHTG